MRMRLSIGLVWMSGALALAACGGKESPSTAGDTAVDPAASAAATGAAPTDANANATWSPEALENLLAPIALFPDVVLGHVLTASTNPQEVLDAGNWLIEQQDLTGSQLDAEAEKLGLSPSVRALVQFPEVMDMLCMKMDWTAELGQAFTADQAAVLDAVQRLRVQARDVGNLESSAQLKVETQTQEGKEIVTVEPPSPEIVYVPTYDPQAVYAPPPATIPLPSTIAVAGVPTTTTVVEKQGHSTGALVTTGLLAFGAGILVNEIFDDDDDWNKYGPNYYHGGMYYGGRPYYPPPPYMYRPPYGPGYRPGHNYNRPPNYQHGFNNNTIIVNNGGNDYWNKYGNKPGQDRPRPHTSPITAANPKRSDLDNLNRQARERPRPDQKPAATRDASRDRPAQSGYAGARPENQAARDKMVAKSPPAGVARDLPARPKTEYKGAQNRPAAAKGSGISPKPAAASRPTQASRPATREPPKQRPAGTIDRGRDSPAAARPASSKPQAKPSLPQKPSPQARPAAPKAKAPDRTAFNTGGGAQAGRSDKAASQRGRSSMGGGGGGGGGKKPRKPKH